MAPDQEVDQRGRGERLCKKILERILFREDTMDRSRWKKLAGKDWMVFRICEWVDVSSTGWSRKKNAQSLALHIFCFVVGHTFIRLIEHRLH